MRGVIVPLLLVTLLVIGQVAAKVSRSKVAARQVENENSSYEIDNTYDLLKDLKSNSETTRDEIVANWKVYADSSAGQSEKIKASLDGKGKECAALDETAAKNDGDIVETKKFIDWVEKKFTSEQAKLDDLLVQRCALNKVFINRLKRDKVALSLLEFIKTAINNQQSFSESDKTSFNQQFSSFLQAYQNNDTAFLLQMKDDLVDAQKFKVDVDYSSEARTSEEIGLKHVDNGKGELKLDNFISGGRKDWRLYKVELIAIIESIQANVKDQMKKAIDDEIAASVALATFKNTILKEIDIFKREFEKQKDILVKLELAQVNNVAAAAKCSAEFKDLKGQEEFTNSDYVAKKIQYEKQKGDVDSEIDLFQEIIDEFYKKVASNDDEFKARQDDYIDDGKFDNDSYDERKVPKIRKIENDV